MKRFSTLNNLLLKLYKDPLSEEEPVKITEENEFEYLQEVKSTIEQEPLAQPSETSIDIIMAYALAKEHPQETPTI